MRETNAAIVLAGGKGSRMHMDIPKQYMLINGRPLITYALDTFEQSDIERIVVVVEVGGKEYFQKNILEKYGYTKVCAVVEGGAERYNSVWNGLQAVKRAGYVLIHDGARPCVDADILKRGMDSVRRCGASIAAVQVKDTIKVVSSEGCVTDTPDRSTLWQIQTPQIFDFEKIYDAYQRMMDDNYRNNITDDAMVMEIYGDLQVHVYEGSYDNIKVTTPEDVKFVSEILANRG